METFDPHVDYTTTTSDHDSIYETIMDVQNTIQEINQLLQANEQLDSNEDQDQDTVVEPSSVYDGIF